MQVSLETHIVVVGAVSAGEGGTYGGHVTQVSLETHRGGWGERGVTSLVPSGVPGRRSVSRRGTRARHKRGTPWWQGPSSLSPRAGCTGGFSQMRQARMVAKWSTCELGRNTHCGWGAVQWAQMKEARMVAKWCTCRLGRCNT